MSNYIKLTAVALFSLFSLCAFSQPYSVTSSQFRFQASENGFSTIDSMVWSPATGGNTSPGIHIKVHGEPHSDYASCPEYVPGTRSNCNFSGCFTTNLGLLDASANTGLIGQLTAWTPACPSTPGGSVWAGDTIIAVVPGDTSTSGLGLYTRSGAGVSGSPAFMQPKRYGETTDGYLTDTYTSMDAQFGSMKPFGALCEGSECSEYVRLRVRSEQQIVVSYPPQQSSPTTRGIQKMAFVLHNVADLPTPNQQPDELNIIKVSRIEFSPNIFCTGENCTSPYPKIYFDSNQGGAPFVGGKVPNNGELATILDSTGGRFKDHTAWRSFGPSTTSIPDEQKIYEIQISWGDFVATLRHATYMTMGSDGNYLNGHHNPDVARIFGNGWSVRENWELKNVRFAQEVVNRNWDSNAIAYLGGRMKWFQLDAHLHQPPGC